MKVPVPEVRPSGTRDLTSAGEEKEKEMQKKETVKERDIKELENISKWFLEKSKNFKCELGKSVYNLVGTTFACVVAHYRHHVESINGEYSTSKGDVEYLEDVRERIDLLCSIFTSSNEYIEERRLMGKGKLIIEKGIENYYWREGGEEMEEIYV